MTAPPRAYPDLHDHIETLKKAGLLIVVDRRINKDTEMHPLVRWQFRGGIREEDRRAFLFTNVTDSKGRTFDIPVLVCGLAGNRAIYSLGMQCAIDEILDKWIRAMTNPIPPRTVEDAPYHEIVYTGTALTNGHELDDIPVPISTPGWDNAPYTTSSHFVTKDPETRIQNVGNYRGQVKAPDRLGMNTSIELRTGGYLHWLKWKALGQPMPCAVVLGCPPAVSFTAVQKLPEHADELHVTGGLIGTPLNVVQAKTVDLLVPAEAEIVIESFVSTEYLEPEAPFGESHGHVNLQEYNGYMDVTAITRRKNAILTSWVSQVTPSESSCIKRPAYEAAQMIHLRDHLGIKGVHKVVTHEPLTSLHKLIVVQFEKGVPQTEIWRALYGVASFRRAEGKWVVAVDRDIDAGNSDAIFWAMSYRCKPHRDVQTLLHKDEGHGPRSGTWNRRARSGRNWDCRRFGRRCPGTATTWASGTNDHLEHQAQRAVRSEYWDTGTWCAKHRRSDVPMNTEIRTLERG